MTMHLLSCLAAYKPAAYIRVDHREIEDMTYMYFPFYGVCRFMWSIG
jgi:hypothetical protein